jgi:hypothetical protein
MDNSGSASYRNIGDVTGTGIVIGDGSSSSVVIGQSLSPIQTELSEKLDDFMDLLTRHEDSVEDARGMRESLVEAQREARQPSPRWPVVRTLLRGIAASVSGVVALTDAMNNILTIIGRLPK